MFPFFEIFNDSFRIYTFGLTLTVCFFLFLWMLKKLSFRYPYKFSFFTKNIVWYFLSVFIFSRLFFVISKWSDLAYINNPFQFFITSDYNFSLVGAIFGFLLVLFINLHLKKEHLEKYIDGLVLAFLLALFVGYMGAFFGGQVYGRETTIGIEILYTHPFTTVPYEVPIFPLSIVYALLFFIEFSALYMASMFINIKGFIGYIGLIIFSSILLIFEFFSGKYDIFKDALNFNLTQAFSIIIIAFSSYYLYKLIKYPENEDNVIY